MNQFGRTCDYEIKGVYDPIIFDVLCVEVETKSPSGGTFTLVGLEDYIHDNSSLFLTYVGDYGLLAFEETENGHRQAIQPSIDIGTRGVFRQLFPFEINDIGDLVDNYDRLEQEIQNWPTGPKAARYFSSNNGLKVGYYRQPRTRK